MTLHKSQQTVIAKFGGTSMAQPELVAQRLKEYANSPNVIVVSAPGKDPECNIKLTDLLINYERRHSLKSRQQIQDRMTNVVVRTPLASDVRQKFLYSVRADLDTATSNDDAVAALGEKWSARLLADITGRTFVDAANLIYFSKPGKLDERKTQEAISQILSSDKQYVVPGFYGSLPNGRITTFERGGSDITGALVAKMIQAVEYHNWSDVEGFYSADPRKVLDAMPIAEITYREARELGNGGNELLNKEVARYLGGTGTATYMYSTFTGKSKTQVVDSRDWSKQPIVGITGAEHMTEMYLFQYGLDEASGTTDEIYKRLSSNDIPYLHVATSTDGVSIYIAGEYHDRIRALFSESIEVDDAAMIHIVGEGLSHLPNFKAATVGRAVTAISESGQNLGIVGMTDTRHSPGTTLFVEPEQYRNALEAVHRALIEKNT